MDVRDGLAGERAILDRNVERVGLVLALNDLGDLLHGGVEVRSFCRRHVAEAARHAQRAHEDVAREDGPEVDEPERERGAVENLGGHNEGTKPNDALDGRHCGLSQDGCCTWGEGEVEWRGRPSLDWIGSLGLHRTSGLVTAWVIVTELLLCSS